jgi:hypothetical protein
MLEEATEGFKLLIREDESGDETITIRRSLRKSPAGLFAPWTRSFYSAGATSERHTLKPRDNEVG